MEVRIKTLAHGDNRLDGKELQQVAQLPADQFNSVKKMPEFFRLAHFDRPFSLERARQIVDDRQQLAGNLSDNAVVSFTAFAFDSFAIVFKVRLPASQCLLRFGKLGLQPFQFGARGHQFSHGRTTLTRRSHLARGGVFFL